MDKYFSGFRHHGPFEATIGNEKVYYSCSESWLDADRSCTIRCKAGATFSYAKTIGIEEKEVESFNSFVEATLGSEHIASLKSHIEAETSREFTLKRTETEKDEFTFPAPGCGRQTYFLYQLVRDHQITVEKQRWGGLAKPLITSASLREKTSNFDVREEVDRNDRACPCPAATDAGPADVLRFQIGNLSLRVDCYEENDRSLSVMIGRHTLKAQPVDPEVRDGQYRMPIVSRQLPELFWNLSGIRKKNIEVEASLKDFALSTVARIFSEGTVVSQVEAEASFLTSKL